MASKKKVLYAQRGFLNGKQKQIDKGTPIKDGDYDALTMKHYGRLGLLGENNPLDVKKKQVEKVKKSKQEKPKQEKPKQEKPNEGGSATPGEGGAAAPNEGGSATPGDQTDQGGAE